MTRREGPGASLLPIVWFLLQPPVSGGDVLSGAPLRSWVVNGRFATQEECDATRRMNLGILAYAESTGGTSAAELSKRRVITDARCVSDQELRAILAPPSPTAPSR